MENNKIENLHERIIKLEEQMNNLNDFIDDEIDEIKNINRMFREDVSDEVKRYNNVTKVSLVDITVNYIFVMTTSYVVQKLLTKLICK